MSSATKGDPIMVRIVAGFCAVGALIGIATGMANPSLHTGRKLTVLMIIGVYFLITSIGTMRLRKLAAVLLVSPLALAGIAVVVVTCVEGPWAAFWLNLILSLPLLCAPAIVIYVNRRCMH